MDFLRKHCVLFLALAILFPSAISLTHIYFHKSQEVCFDAGQPHYHKKNLDCKLCDLRYSSHFTYNLYNPQIFKPDFLNNRFFNYYQFLSEYQKLPFGLRGPPAV